MASKGAMKAAEIITASGKWHDMGRFQTWAAETIDRETGAAELGESIIQALADDIDLYLTERQINVMRSIVERTVKGE